MALPGDRVFLPWEGKPGDPVDLGGTLQRAPARPACVSLARIDLGDASRIIAQGGEAPDTALAWSPTGDRLAVGTFRGEVLVVDAGTGRVIRRETFPEAVIKTVAWSSDGETLYASEQSPDALLYALDPTTLQPRWSFRLADEVETSPLPPDADLYGVYTLPGAYGLDVLPSGDLVVAAVHAWNQDGHRLNRSRILRLSPDGSRVAAWPPDGPADATLMHPSIDTTSGLLAVPVGRSADGPAPDLPINGVQILTLDSLTPQGTFRPEPLLPYFQQVFPWEALDLDHGTLLEGLGDGRVFLHAPDHTVRIDLGTPLLSGDVPIAASVGFGVLRAADVIVQTARTNIPYGAANPAARPPSAHPGENALWSYNLDGRLRWSWRGPHALAGLTLGLDGHELLVGAGPRVADDRRDLFGVLVFDLDRTGPGVDPLVTVCPTASPVFFRQALSPTGWIAAATHPFVTADGNLEGDYAVEIFR